ncbi:uncharacterized protein [Syngnathus scovelli]|uniref:uncharacterized protein isoform X2 n=1 Tax=Syngnathus scovelli TaxID=161590 RepID=UPI0035CBD978
MVAMKFCAASVVLLLLIGQSEVFGLLPTWERDRSFRTRTMTQDSTVPPELSVIWTELLGLRQLVLSLQAAVVEQRQSLRTSESRMRDGQEVVEKQRQQLDAMHIQMDVDRMLVLSLQAASVDQHNTLRTIETRLRDSEEVAEKKRQVLDSLQVQVEADKKTVSEINADLKRREEHRQEEVSRLHSRVNASEGSVEDLKRKTTALADDLPFLRMRLRASESALDQLKRKSSVLASRLCLVENLRKTSSVADAEVQVHQNSSQGHTSALTSEKDGQWQKIKSRVETDSSNIHQNMSAFHARLLHLEGKIMTGEQHLQDIRGLEVQMNVVKNHVEDLWTEISVKSGQLSNMEAQLGNGCNNTAALEGNVKMAEAHVEKLKVLSSALEVRLNVSERLLEELKTECTALDRRLNVSDKFQEQLKTESRGELLTVTERLKLTEAEVGDLWMKNTAQTTRVSNMESRLTDSIQNTAAVEVRLNISEKILEELKTECTAWATHLSNVEFQLTHNINNTEVLLRRLNMNGQKINNLKETTEDLMSRLHVLEQHGTQTSGETKVAFAAALTDSGSVGPFDQETTLIFSKVFTNIGRAYDETSGVFTAPVDGIYVFSFTAADFLKGYMGVTLYCNRQPIVSSLDLNDHGGYASATNGVLIPLEAGDRVRLSLPASYRLYDDMRSFSVFSGFLLFQLEADQ